MDVKDGPEDPAAAAAAAWNSHSEWTLKQQTQEYIRHEKKHSHGKQKVPQNKSHCHELHKRMTEQSVWFMLLKSITVLILGNLDVRSELSDKLIGKDLHQEITHKHKHSP